MDRRQAVLATPRQEGDDMKMTLDWHRNCLKNQREHYARLRRQAESDMARTLQGESDVAFYEQQITEAEKRGMTAFDRDRLCKSNTPPCTKQVTP